MHYSKPPKPYQETGYDIDLGNYGIVFSGREWEIRLAETIKIHELKLYEKKKKKIYNRFIKNRL